MRSTRSDAPSTLHFVEMNKLSCASSILASGRVEAQDLTVVARASWRMRQQKRFSTVSIHLEYLHVLEGNLAHKNHANPYVGASHARSWSP